MSIKVITPPAPFVTPADIAGSHPSDDPAIVRMIEAAVEELDGYTGWLGRCLAPQLLEYSAVPYRAQFSLPIGPVLEVESVSIEDHGGVLTALQSGTYWLRDSDVGITSWLNSPGYRQRHVRYWAGYGVRDTNDATKWVDKVPARVKQAVIMSVQHMKALSAENLFLRSEDVEGVGARSYTVSEQAGAIIHDTANRLLSGLKVPRI
ncbi:head-tail connector protein [Devosia aurantiaca]|uniref:Uncharacterized protein n=1 Tax=Devosia aurantiaca TaxID=2714858 RepID=A0A6M1SHI0_9HYPH|nr:hypothetical protein [Devosia aurantiaca]NGP18917.1 hypothetical protein [Devosia aurantiaca]